MTPYEKAMCWSMIEMFLSAAKKSASKQDFLATFDNTDKVLVELRKLGKESQEK